MAASRGVRRLTPEQLELLPDTCRACLFWEVANAPRGPDTKDPDFALKSKEAWWQAAALERQIVSRAVFIDEALVGYALVGEPGTVPRARRLGPAPSEDALLLATLWVHPDHRGQGLAKLLLQTVLRDAARTDHRAVEAFGSTEGATATCVLSEDFLEKMGFTKVGAHVRYGLYRLDLRQTVRWPESVGAALEGVKSALGRRKRPVQRPVLEAHGLFRDTGDTAPGRVTCAKGHAQGDRPTASRFCR